MAEYIEREALLAEIDAAMDNNGMGYVVGQTLKRYIKRQPAADVAPVVHGEWVAKNGRIVCDHCEALIAVCPNRYVLEENMKFFKENEKFCYNCGAKMDGGKNDAADS